MTSGHVTRGTPWPDARQCEERGTRDLRGHRRPVAVRKEPIVLPVHH